MIRTILFSQNQFLYIYPRLCLIDNEMKKTYSFVFIFAKYIIQKGDLFETLKTAVLFCMGSYTVKPVHSSIHASFLFDVNLLRKALSKKSIQTKQTFSHFLVSSNNVNIFMFQNKAWNAHRYVNKDSTIIITLFFRARWVCRI